MFSWKSDDKKKKPASRSAPRPPRDDARLAQMGLLGVGGLEDLVDDKADEGLEAELLALMEEDAPPPPRPPKQQQVTRDKERAVLPEGLRQLDNMVTECLSENYDVEVTSDDEDDPALMDELLGLSETAAPEPTSVAPREPTRNAPVIQRPSPAAAGVSVLALRIFSRGLKTLYQMKKSLEAGKAINEEDIPPEVVVRSASRAVTPTLPTPAATPTGPLSPEHFTPAPSDPATFTPTPASPRENLPPPEFPSRPAANKSFEVPEARDAPLRKASTSSLPHALAFTETVPHTTTSVPATPTVNATTAAPAPAPAASEEFESVPEPPPVPPGSILDALQDRRAKYVEQLEKAKSEGNGRKERMNDRIIKQYDDAIKRHKLGKPVAYGDLPSPPGFAPLPASVVTPAPGAVAPTTPAVAPTTPAAAAATTPIAAVTTPATPPTSALPAQAQTPGGDSNSPAKVPRQQPPGVTPPKPNVRAAPKSRVERQMSLLTKRQDQFKAAALEAKKKGEIELAKEYLRNSKGFDNLIQATAAGLPVDMNTIPVPPQEKAAGGPSLNREVSVDDAFEVINAEDCDMPATSTPADLVLIYTKLEEDLIKQIKMCATTREHFKAVGDVASCNRFEQLIVNTKKELDAVRLAFKRGDKPPRCHYENRSFSIVECNTDLNDSDCEVTVMRGINYNVQNPTDVDTYVKIEFPYPSENCPVDRTGVVKDTNNPEYNHKTLFSIDRKTRALARCFKRHSVKLTVHAKGGWFSRDTIVGCAKVPLVALENHCTLHDSFDLSDERKKMVGGKIEVKLRVRNPILSKEIRQLNEKWLVIDGY
ncbi:coiled-coil and C2 domain-containing protein 1-like [Hyalella azteca]|uniref:Coiled-coil and C2 domain-containing protein 1-like n=1 Tax=Hyalella azteca TaxID=294128 RepID=A0A8B7MYG7_HYAAZ|nr:coiled-coil and C2 domain-containing protein 1-like [Hyalella azteca]